MDSAPSDASVATPSVPEPVVSDHEHHHSPGGTTAATDSYITFEGIAALERWGVEPALSLLRAIAAAQMILQEFAAFKARVKVAMDDGVPFHEATNRPGTSMVRDATAADLVMARLREDASRLAAVARIVHLCAPTRGGSLASPTPRRAAATPGASPGVHDEAVPLFPALWPLVAKHTKTDVATLATHLQLDVACLHALMLPTVSSDASEEVIIRAAVAGAGASALAASPSTTALLCLDETALNDDDAFLVQQLGTAFDLHPAQYLVMCQDALAVLMSTVDQRHHLEAVNRGVQPADRLSAGLTNATTAFRLRTQPTALSDGVSGTSIDIAPDAHLSEENSHYALALRRHASAAVVSLGAAVSRNEMLSPTQVDLINGPLADAVVGTMHLYNVLVSTFNDYRREASRYHRVLLARDSLLKMANEHASGQIAATSRQLALLVGEAVNAMDGLTQDLELVVQWATTCAADAVPTAMASQVGHRRTGSLSKRVFASLCETVDLLSTLQESCRQCLTTHCQPVLKLIGSTLETHAPSLLPLAQATSSIVSELRVIDSTLARELPHLRARLGEGDRDEAHELRVITALLRPLKDDDHETRPSPPSATVDPLTNPLVNVEAIHAESIGKRASIISVVAGNAKHSIMQLPPALAAQLRVLQTPTSIRNCDARLAALDFQPTFHAALMAEVTLLDQTLEEARVSLRKYAANVRTTATQVTPESLKVGIDVVAEAFSNSNLAAYASLNPKNAMAPGGGATPGDSPRRRAAASLSSDQVMVISLLKNLVDVYAMAEKAVLSVASSSFANTGEEGLEQALAAFTNLVSFVEALGEAIYLDVEALRRIGTAPVVFRNQE